MKAPLPDDDEFPVVPVGPDRAGRIDYRLWVRRVVSWDVPVYCLLAIVPTVVEQLLPKEANLILIATLLPILAFFLRVRAGRRQMAENRVPFWLHMLQSVVFYATITLMIFLDSLMLAMHGVAPEAALAFGLFGLCFYMLPMTLAMYPGRMPSEE